MLVWGAVFVAAILTFSRAYNLLLRYFERPTGGGLATLALLVALLLLELGVLGFIMYATDRRLGNVKVKNALFERLLGHPPDEKLPAKGKRS